MADDTKKLTEKLSAFGWGTFFLWIGIAYVLKFSVGIGLLGIGINTLFWQIVRKYFKLKFEGFWIFVGFLFILGGIGVLLKIDIPIIPIILIVAGITVFTSTMKKK